MLEYPWQVSTSLDQKVSVTIPLYFWICHILQLANLCHAFEGDKKGSCTYAPVSPSTRNEKYLLVFRDAIMIYCAQTTD